MFLSITGATPDNKLAKYMSFDTLAEAEAHALEYNGFAIADPGGDQEFWIVDMVAKTVTIDTATQATVTTDRAWQSIRSERDGLLAKTDWRFRSDQTPTQAWIDYCQALRDVTTQADPLNIVWPTEPV